MIHKVFDNVTRKISVPEPMGTPMEHHLQGSDYDNLIELAGRVCYDSLKQKRSRDSKSYHEHINEVNHGSVQEHANFTITIWSNNGLHEESMILFASTFFNRPGIYISLTDNGLRVTTNIRVVREWSQFNNDASTIEIQEAIGNCLREAAKKVSPLSTSDITLNAETNYKFDYKIVPPESDEEIWYSFYIGNVSRGLTHELVRHKFRTAISQRSTRYVDESESDWILHPAFKQINNPDFMRHLNYYINEGQKNYRASVDKLIQVLKEDQGIDSFTARKQARGAARGLLGNALSTELIFSASLAQWKRIINMRGTEWADAEIRLMANEIASQLELPLVEDRECPDGIGRHIQV